MRSAPILIGAFIIIPVLGAVTGASIDTTMVSKSDGGLGPKSSGSVGGSGDSSQAHQLARAEPDEPEDDSFAMDTPDERIELAELRNYGVGRARRDAALEFDAQALEPISDAEIEQMTAEALAPLGSSSSRRSARASRNAAIAAADAARNAVALSGRRSDRRSGSDTAPLYPSMPEPVRYETRRSDKPADPTTDPIY